MGISFKVSKTGTRFRPKPLLESESKDEEDDVAVDAYKESQRLRGKIESGSASIRKQAEICEGDEDATGICDGEVSFTLSLYPDGYTIGKPSEGESGHQNSIEVPKCLHPYDRGSETLFSAIESGRLPGDILDDIPCKYINGMLFCEVRDYRKCFSEAGVNMPSIDGSPIINKVRLRMSLENVVKDIPLISDNGWTYGDLMEVESRILKALQPKLSLDPTPKLEKLHDSHIPTKLNLAVSAMRRKRFRQVPEVTVTSSNNIHGKKVCIDRVPESSVLADSGPMFQQSALENLPSQNNAPSSMVAQRANSFGSNASGPSSPLITHPTKYQMGVGSPRIMQDHRSGSVLNTPGASLGQDMMITYSENVNSSALSFHGKRDSQEAQSSPLSGSNKRSRVTNMGVDGNQQQHVGSQVEGFHGPDSHWKNTLLLQQQALTRGIQYGSTGMQKYSQQMFDGSLHQESGAIPFNQGMRYGLKEEPVDSERLDKSELGRNKNDMHMLDSELNNMDSQQSRLQQRIPQQLMRSSFPQSPWNGQVQPLEGNSRKEDHPYQKRKLVQSPRVSAGGLPQSPLSSKSGEFSSGSVGHQVGAAVTSGFVSSQKDRSVVTSVPPIGGATSLTSSANDSMQRQHQAQFAAKRKSNSLPKTPAMNGVGSPASVSNTSVPLNVSSPPVGTPLADLTVLERFSKIDMVTGRFQLNCKKKKVDEVPIGKSNAFQAQELLRHLSADSSNENFEDETFKFSKSLVGGSINAFKIRFLNFMPPERIIQGNSFSIVPKARTRLTMSMRPNDGTVAMHIGEIENAQYLAVEDYLPTLPNTLTADLLAAQFCSLMVRDGYRVEDNSVQPKQVPMTHAPSGQPNTPRILSSNATTEIQQYSGGVSGQPSNDIAKPSNSGGASLNPSHNLQGTRMLPPGTAQGLQISQGLSSGVSLPSRSQQSDTLPSLLQQQHQQQFQNQQSLMQQQHSQLQRSSLMIAANQMPHLNSLGQNPNMQLGNQMSNKPSPIQLQLLQQQHQQQQQQQQQQQLQPQQHQQQQQQLQRKMMMSLGNVGMGNITNNMVGLGGLGNVMGMAGVRGVGGTGISAPMASIAGMGTMAQNPMNMNQASNISNAISQQLRSGLTPAQATTFMATKLRMAHSRANMLGTPQSTMSSMTGAKPMHPASASLSMLGTALNRGNINPMQRTIGQMGPPKLMAGMNMYMNQQQQQQQLHQQLQFQQQLQQQQQQQETTSPLQAVVQPQQVGSPSNMGIPQSINQQIQQQQQQASPQQMNQRTPMSPQLSSGAMHTISAGNPEACPASPQLSSQTLGSVSSITNSPMDLQGVNKSNSVNNT